MLNKTKFDTPYFGKEILQKELDDYLGKFFVYKKGDDSSFIIKSHAVLEKLVTQLIVDRVGIPEMETHFKNISMGDRQIGKLTVIKSLALLNKDEIGFIRILSEIRNKYAHDIDSLDTDLQGYLDKQKKQKKREILSKFSYLNLNGEESFKEMIIIAIGKIILSSSVKISAEKIKKKVLDMSDEEVMEFLSNK